MAQVIMPKMGDAMEEGTLLKWLKNPGDEVSEGDPIAEIETDKVTLEIEAAEDGFLTQTMVNEGDVVPIGTPIAMIGAEDEVGQAPAEPARAEAATPANEPPVEIAREPERAANLPSAQPEAAAISAPPAAPAATPPATNGQGDGQVIERRPGERLRASPLVKRLAAEHGIDLAQVVGSGPGGRIIKDDLKDYISGAKPVPQAQPAAAQAAAPATPQAPAAQPAAAPVSGAPKGAPVELSRIKARTGERMSFAKQTIPHYYVTSNVDMTEALAFRAQVNGTLGEDGVKVSVNDLIVKAAALALREHPEVNRSFENGQLFDHDAIDINIAIALDGGLIAPFVPNADQKSLGAIARMTKDLGNRARHGGLTPEEYQGGTFTISNLGMFDVAEFIAVINPPQAAILAIGSVTPTPVIRDGEVAVGQIMKITLSADHRVLDGAEVARFLQTVKRYLESPMLLAVS